jgi:IS4 transposase
VTDAGADALFRAPAGVQLPALKWLADGSYLSYSPEPKARVAASAKIRDGRKKITDLPGFYVRVVDYEVAGRGRGDEFFTIVTTILDPEETSAIELAAAYHERWEIELAFDEVKTHQRGPAVILRSKSPEMVTQELWGLFLAHYCVRKLMTEAADQAEIDPDRLSFIRSLRVIRRQVTSQAAFSP